MTPRLSRSTRALLEAVKSDAPSAATKAKVWAGVGAATGLGAGAAAAIAGVGASTPPAAAGGGTLATGLLSGGAIVVGMAVTLLRFAAPPASHVLLSPRHDPAADLEAPAAGPGRPQVSPASLPAPRVEAAPVPDPAAVAVPAAAPAHSPSLRPHAVGGSTTGWSGDALEREASLVAAARSALLRGDPVGALRKVRAARALPSAQLAPEELSIEARALRLLGRGDEADNVDAKLRSAFPESALAP